MYRGLIIRMRPAVIRTWPIAVLLALFGILYSLTLNSYGMFLWDESEYASIGRSVLRGQGYAISGALNALRPPILPLAGAASMWLFGEQSDDAVLRMVSWGFGLLALACAYGFAAAAYGRTTGLVATTLLGLSPFFWTFVPYFLSEIPFLAFFAAAVWFFYFGAYQDRRFFLWSWICWGLAFLTRYNASLFLPVIALYIPLAWWTGGEDTRSRLASRFFFLSPLAALALLLPWLIREYATFGNALAGLRQASRQLQDYLPSIGMPWNYYLGRMPYMLSPMIAILFIAGVIWAGWKRDRFAMHNVLVAALILAWFSCYRYKEERLVSSALPFIAVVAAGVLTQATAKLRPLPRNLILAAALSGLFVLNFHATRPVFKNWFTLGYPSFLDAMAFLRVHAGAGATVLGANFPQIHWYSGLHAINIPEEQDLPEALRHSEWVIITNFEPVQKPYVVGLIDRAAASPETPDSAATFQDSRCFTFVIRSDRLLRALTQ